MKPSVVPMLRSHIPACLRIVSLSEPWKTLKEGIDFPQAMRRKQAFICLADSTVAGFVIFTPESVFARGGYLRAIGVAPEMRRNGIGRKLLDFAEKTTAKKSANLFLCVSSFNRPAQAFYRRCGYEKVGKLDDLLKKGASEYIYLKRLHGRKPQHRP
jgi:ribosomal protein S18 acetylase RimI-like enzyme